jgi:hypothetical protein
VLTQKRKSTAAFAEEGLKLKQVVELHLSHLKNSAHLVVVECVWIADRKVKGLLEKLWGKGSNASVSLLGFCWSRRLKSKQEIEIN